MRPLTALIVFVFLTGTPGLGLAQDTLTLEQALGAARAQNYSLRVARSSADEARASATVARSSLFPSVTVAESWQRGDQPVFVFSSLLSARRFAADNFLIDALNHPDPTGFFRTTVGLEQVVFDGGRRSSASRAAALHRDIADLGAAQAVLDLDLSVTQAYGRVLTAQAALRAAEAGLDAAREDQSRAERRRDEGLLTDADVLGLIVHVSELEQRAIQAQGDAAVASAELSHLMGAPVTTSFTVVEPMSPQDNDLELPALRAEALASRPAVQQAETASRLAEAMHRAARGGLLPQLSAQASFDLSGTQLTRRSSSWLAGAELRWSFGVAGAERAHAKAAAEAAVRARTERDEMRGRVEVEIVSAIRQLEAARARQEVGRATVAQARESQRIIRDRFEVGLAGTDDVLRASAAVLDAERNRTAAGVDALTARAMLDRAVGRTPDEKD